MKLNNFFGRKSSQTLGLSSSARTWALVLIISWSFNLESASASFCKAALKAMGQNTIESENRSSNNQVDMRKLINTIIDTKDMVIDIKKEQARALAITKATHLIHQRVNTIINSLGPKKTLLKRQSYFTHLEASEFAKYSSQLKTLKLSIEHLQLAVPISIEKIVSRMVTYHTNVSDALVHQMEDTLLDLVRNDSNSSKIVELEILIENQALNSQNDRILDRLKELIDGLRIVDDSVNNSLVPEVIPLINETNLVISAWLKAYNDPLFNELFQNYPSDIVFEAFQKTQDGTLSYSHSIIVAFIESIERSRN